MIDTNTVNETQGRAMLRVSLETLFEYSQMLDVGMLARETMVKIGLSDHVFCCIWCGRVDTQLTKTKSGIKCMNAFECFREMQIDRDWIQSAGFSLRARQYQINTYVSLFDKHIQRRHSLIKVRHDALDLDSVLETVSLMLDSCKILTWETAYVGVSSSGIAHVFDGDTPLCRSTPLHHAPSEQDMGSRSLCSGCSAKLWKIQHQVINQWFEMDE